MKRFFFLFSLLLCTAAMSLAQFQQSKLPLADPFVFYEDGTYYAYGTYSSNGIVVFTSSNLIEWEEQPQLALHKDNCTEKQWFWAPEVYKINDEYIMYFSANEHLFVAKSSSPLGPFKQVGGYQLEALLGSEKCIDSSMFLDDDGKAYLFFVRFTDGNCIWMCQLESDCITPKVGTMKHCFSVSADWENIAPRVVEGPNMVKHNGIYYLTYSANNYESQDYAIGYATTPSLSEPKWTKAASNPILRRIYDLVGTGHHTIFNDANGQLRIAFHAHNSTTAVHPRLTYIGSMQFNDDRLEVAKEPFIRPVKNGEKWLNFEKSAFIDIDRGYERGGSTVVDLNNDGHLDIVSGGATRNVHNSISNDAFGKRRMMHISLWDDNSKSWTDIDGASSAIQVADYPVLLPCDINHDGTMDIVAFESIGKSVNEDAYKNNLGSEGVFLGNGDGTFRSATLRILDTGGNLLDFDIKAPHTAAILDCDNDGLTDIACIGNQGSACYNYILRNKGFNGDEFTFVAEPFIQEFNLSNAVIHTADFNNDGFSDLIISAKVSDVTGMSCLTEIYLNNPEIPGNFSALGINDGSATVVRKGGGTLKVADFNNDGRIDFFLTGNGDANMGSTAYEQTVYVNKGGERPAFKVVTGYLKYNSYRGSSSPDAVGVIDWDGDGDFDIVISGYVDKINDNTTAHVYTNEKSSGAFMCSTLLPGALSHTISFPDWNGDGVKDYCCQGYFKDDLYLTAQQKGRTMVVALNSNSAAPRPDAPIAPTATVGNSSVTLSWDAPASALGCESYEYFVKDADGNLITDCAAIVGGELDGVRKANTFGNAGCNKSITFFPKKSGKFSWGVQTVNATFDGSAFATGNDFEIEISGIADVSADAPEVTETVHFNAIGQQVVPCAKGLHIVRMSDGSHTKRIVK